MLIISVVVDVAGNLITLNGRNFDNLDHDYAESLVELDEVELTVTSRAAEVVTASLDALPSPPLGNHLVSVQAGEAPERCDDHCFVIDADWLQPPCDYTPPSTGWVQRDRVSYRYVPKGPPRPAPPST